MRGIKTFISLLLITSTILALPGKMYAQVPPPPADSKWTLEYNRDSGKLNVVYRETQALSDPSPYVFDFDFYDTEHNYSIWSYKTGGSDRNIVLVLPLDNNGTSGHFRAIGAGIAKQQTDTFAFPPDYTSIKKGEDDIQFILAKQSSAVSIIQILSVISEANKPKVEKIVNASIDGTPIIQKYHKAVAPLKENTEACNNHMVYPVYHKDNKTSSDSSLPYRDEKIFHKAANNLKSMIESSNRSESIKDKAYSALKTVLYDVKDPNYPKATVTDAQLADAGLTEDKDLEYYNTFFNSKYEKGYNQIPKADLKARNASGVPNYPPISYPNVILTDDVLIDKFEPLVTEFKTAFPGKSINWLGILAGFAGGGGAAMTASGILLPVGIPLTIVSGIVLGYTEGIDRKSEADLVKDMRIYIKQSVAAEYIYANYRFNKCLADKGDDYAFLNPITMNLLSGRGDVTLGDTNDSECSRRWPVSASPSSWGNSIWGALCTVSVGIIDFLGERLINASKLLMGVIGLHTG